MIDYESVSLGVTRLSCLCYRSARRRLAQCYICLTSVTDQHEDVSLGVTRLSCPCYRSARRCLVGCYTSFVSLLQISTKMSRWVLHVFRVLVTDQHEDAPLGFVHL